MSNESATEVVIRFFAALEAGDIETVRSIYSPDALIWHNDDLIEQSVDGQPSGAGRTA